jgi:oligoribonuclease NrnB/cAMP/cGMP phosphodiesterase (DHH superfamily)
MKIVDNANELNRIQFETQHRNYIFDMLSLSIPYINLNNSHIKLDEDIYHIKKRFFMQSDKNDTIDNLIAKYNVSLLKEKKEQYTIHYKEHKGILTYAVKNSSILGNEFLVQNPDYDFFLNINGKKTVSLRASGNIDVSLLAKDIFDGGGHKNASGGRFRELKDSFIYQNIRDQVQEKLSQ